jgi:hypothetical protein
MVLSTNVTLRTLTLGTQDATTGWYAKTFADSTIKMVIQKKGSQLIGTNMGVYAKHTLSGFTQGVVVEGDEIKDSYLNYYEVHSTEDIPLADSLLCRECELVKLPIHYDRPATYGTGATVDDPRKRTKAYLDPNWAPPGYLLTANLLEDNGTTQATFITCWDGADYPLKRVFVDKAVDLVFSIGRTTSKPLSHPAYPAYGAVASSEGVYGYDEKLPIEIFTVDKVGITGENLKWQAERELRRILETYPFGTKREIETFDHKNVDLGSLILHSLTVEFAYKRGVT